MHIAARTNVLLIFVAVPHGRVKATHGYTWWCHVLVCVLKQQVCLQPNQNGPQLIRFLRCECDDAWV